MFPIYIDSPDNSRVPIEYIQNEFKKKNPPEFVSFNPDLSEQQEDESVSQQRRCISKTKITIEGLAATIRQFHINFTGETENCSNTTKNVEFRLYQYQYDNKW